MLVLYDGDCGICTAAMDRLRRFAGPRMPQIRAYQDLGDDELLALGTTREECASALQVRIDGGRWLSGARAVNQLARLHRLAGPVAAFFDAVPPLLWIEEVVYRMVARNRSAISRRLGLVACAPTRTVTGEAGERR
jgi:predicted DCC family thiol-disulfide oxidoreductase YuxK